MITWSCRVGIQEVRLHGNPIRRLVAGAVRLNAIVQTGATTSLAEIYIILFILLKLYLTRKSPIELKLFFSQAPLAKTHGNKFIHKNIYIEIHIKNT